MHQCIKFILFWNDTLHVSDGLAFCSLLASKQRAVSVAVCTVLNSWWWTARPSETWRMSFQNKIIWYIGASSWFYYRSYGVTKPPTSTQVSDSFRLEPFMRPVKNKWVFVDGGLYGCRHLSAQALLAWASCARTDGGKRCAYVCVNRIVWVLCVHRL